MVLVIAALKIEFKKLTTELDLPKKLKGSKINEAKYQQNDRKACQKINSKKRSIHFGQSDTKYECWIVSFECWIILISHNS